MVLTTLHKIRDARGLEDSYTDENNHTPLRENPSYPSMVKALDEKYKGYTEVPVLWWRGGGIAAVCIASSSTIVMVPMRVTMRNFCANWDKGHFT